MGGNTTVSDLSYSIHDLPNIMYYQQLNFLIQKQVLKEISDPKNINSYDSSKSEIYYVQLEGEDATYSKFNIFNDRSGEKCISQYSSTLKNNKRKQLSNVVARIQFAYKVLPNKVKSLMNILKEQYPDLHKKYEDVINSATNTDFP